MMRAIVMLGWGCLTMVGCATLGAGAPKGVVDVIAHRGASAYAPENTLAAFALAADQGADWFELDCTLTQDGAVVVIHDDTIDRTTGARGTVAEMTLAEVRRYDVGSWFGAAFSSERIPTLEEALDLGKSRRIGVYVEIKNSDDDQALMAELMRLADGEALLPGRRDAMMEQIAASGSRNLILTRKTIAAIRERAMERQVVIQSFSPIVCAVALAEAPELRTELLASSSRNDPLQWTRYLEWLGLLDAAGFNINGADFSEGLLRDVHAAGRTMAVWTVDDPDEMRAFVRAGVDALITNRPDVALSVLSR